MALASSSYWGWQMKRFWHWLLAGMLMTILAACGGGGGSSGVPGGSVNPSSFFVNAPTALTVVIGQKAIFPISGGNTPYIASSSASTVALASIEEGNLAVSGVKTGSASIRVTPTGGGAEFSMQVTVVANSVPFAVQAPDTVTLNIGNNASYALIGGVAPYKATSSDEGVLKAEVVGTQLRLTGIKKGSASVDVYDSDSGNLLPIKKTVNVVEAVAFYTTAPTGGVTLYRGATLSFTVGGGVAQYFAASNNSTVLEASVNGSTLSLTGIGSGSANVSLRDSAGSVISVPVTVAMPSGFFTTAPATLTLDGVTARSFEVSGGTRYSAQSSNESVVVATVSAPGSDTKAILTLTPKGNGTANVQVTDSTGGSSIAIAVTVVNGSGTSGSGAVSSVDVTTDKQSLPSAGGEATITAFVKNAANVAMPNVPVEFRADSGTLISAESTTNAAGVATVKLSPGSNKSNRTIAVTATAGTKSGTVNVVVSGSTLTITGGSTQQLGASSTYSVRAVDSSGNPLAGAGLTFTSVLGNALTPATATTDASGNATFSYTAGTSGTDTLTVTGPGTMRQTTTVTISAVSLSFTSPAPNTSVNVNALQAVKVQYLVGGVAQVGKTVNFSSTRGIVSSASVLTDASGDASVNVSSATAGPATITAQIAGVGAATLPVTFVATTPSTITLQATPSAISPNQTGSTNQSTLSAVVRDAAGNLVANQTVNFNLVSDLSGGTLSAGTAVTDANGRAQVQFIAGATSTPANGVRVQASVVGIPVSEARLTVSGSALFISFGISNEISNLDSTTYTKRFSVYVTDANGVAVGNQIVNLSVIPVSYGKGTLSWGTSSWGYSAGSPTTCPNEDINGNGILDAGEDSNGNGRLTPGNVVVASPGSLTTDTAGRAYFDLQYGEQYAPWIVVQIKARAAVAGTESITTTDFVVVGMASDFTVEGVSPAGRVSPFGTVASCSNPN